MKRDSAPLGRPELSPVDVQRYDTVQYGGRSWSTILWELEKAYLDALLNDRAFVPRREHYLDFACGSGRVMQYLGPNFELTTGVDISSTMLSRAHDVLPSARLICGDVGSGQFEGGRKVDLLTSFRFLLNADPRDRLPALTWMRRQLRDSHSRVIINNHGNLASHKALPYAARRLRGVRPGGTGNVLSHREVVALATQAGFRVVTRRGFGYFGGSALRIVPYPMMAGVQRGLGGVPGFDRLAEDQVYLLAPR